MTAIVAHIGKVVDGIALWGSLLLRVKNDAIVLICYAARTDQVCANEVHVRLEFSEGLFCGFRSFP